MDLFIDSNVFVANLVDEPGRGDAATAVLDSDHTLYTSLLNIMEVRTVLAKKKRFEQDEVQQALTRIVRETSVLVPDAGDLMAANNLQNQTLLYTMDAILASIAETNDLTHVSFDSELQEHGAVDPGDVV
ncbi:type II toxin-antitoxin system VapC family toxin [Halolamina sp.]|uniref:type II toxin-antitoxin system VapC family toxin n=1 Tax=Halolamina sp. TaxID=1940283 RepID=UPI0035627FFF